MVGRRSFPHIKAIPQAINDHGQIKHISVRRSFPKFSLARAVHGNQESHVAVPMLFEQQRRIGASFSPTLTAGIGSEFWFYLFKESLQISLGRHIFFVHLFTRQLKQKSKMSGKNLVFIDPKLHSTESISQKHLQTMGSLPTIRICCLWFLISHQVCLQHLFFGACLNPENCGMKIMRNYFPKGPNHHDLCKWPNHHLFYWGTSINLHGSHYEPVFLGRIPTYCSLERCVNWLSSSPRPEKGTAYSSPGNRG